MKLWRYTLGPVIAYCATVIVALLIALCVKCKSSLMYEDLKKWIAVTAFPDILEEREMEEGSKVWFFGKRKLMKRGENQKEDKETRLLIACCINRIAGISFFTFTTASFILWQTLLIDISFDCEPHDTTKECFPYNSKEQLEFKETLANASANPVDCSSEEIVNGTVTVICYRYVFNIGYAAGAGLGVFRLISFVLSFAAAKLVLKSEAVIMALKGLVIFLLAGVTALLMLAAFLWDKVTLHPALDFDLDTSKINIIGQVVSCIVTILLLVFGIPWKKLGNRMKQKRGTDNEERNTRDIGLQNIS